MSADKRTVSTDALETLGAIIDDKQKRDAIHLAVEPVIAGEDLDPGCHITVRAGVAMKTAAGAGLGIVDPFLTVTVKKGKRFWFVMYPRQVRSLRHVWTHPAFPDDTVVAQTDDPRKEEARAFIASVARGLGVGVEEIVDHARYYVEHGEYWCDGGRFESEYIPDEFWPHYEILTGTKVPEEDRGSFLSCSC